MQPGDTGDKFRDVIVRGVEDDLLGRPHLNNRAVLHDRDPVADTNRFVQIVSDEYCRLAQFLGQLAELILQLPANQRVERAERLIHQDHFRVCGDCPGKPYPLLHAPGQFAGVARHPVAQPDFGQGLLGNLVALGLAHALYFQSKRRVLQNRTVRQQRNTLENHADMTCPHLTQLCGIQRREFFALDYDLAGAGCDEFVQQPYQRRFATA
ncbi:hypothetical protein D3C78_728400 [compost metagenome]